MKHRTAPRVVAAVFLSSPLLAMAAAPVIDVYKSALCGCCAKWVNHLETNGFTVKVRNVVNPSYYREIFGVPQALGSCHTALVHAYAIEGHVPARDIERLLVERPKAKGLVVPSMPMGAPGMEGQRSDPYDVLLVEAGGNYSRYHHYNGN